MRKGASPTGWCRARWCRAWAGQWISWQAHAASYREAITPLLDSTRPAAPPVAARRPQLHHDRALFTELLLLFAAFRGGESFRNLGRALLQRLHHPLYFC